MKIGDVVRVKFHPNKAWEPRRYQIVSQYLNNFAVKPAGTHGSARTVDKGLVELWA